MEKLKKILPYLGIVGAVLSLLLAIVKLVTVVVNFKRGGSK